jgi:hypothetical protein
MSVSVLAAPSEGPELVLEVEDSHPRRIPGLALGPIKVAVQIEEAAIAGRPLGVASVPDACAGGFRDPAPCAGPEPSAALRLHGDRGRMSSRAHGLRLGLRANGDHQINEKPQSDDGR